MSIPIVVFVFGMDSKNIGNYYLVTTVYLWITATKVSDNESTYPARWRIWILEVKLLPDGLNFHQITVKHDILATGKYSEMVALWQIACRIK